MKQCNFGELRFVPIPKYGYNNLLGEFLRYETDLLQDPQDL